MQLLVKVYGYQRTYFDYIICKKALLCYHEKNLQLLVKENLRLRVFSVSYFLAAIVEETTKKNQISYKSFQRLVKLQARNQRGEGERSPLPFFKSTLISEKNALSIFIFGLNFSFKLLGKKSPKFSLGPFFFVTG